MSGDNTADTCGDRIRRWLVALKKRVGWQKAVVALANEDPRLHWTVLFRDEASDPEDVPKLPAQCCMLSQRQAR